MLGATDLTARTWTHIVGSAGETEAIFAEATAGRVPWSPLQPGVTTVAPMTWLTSSFVVPSSVLAPDSAGEMNATLNLDVVGLRSSFALGQYPGRVVLETTLE